MFTFAIVTDTHFRVEGDDAQVGYPSDSSHNERNRRVARRVAAAGPALLIHLGDVVHPVPGLGDHAIAIAIATEVLGGIGVPVYVTPGNHDVGDKPRAWENAPGATPEKHATFEQAWGPSWRSFDHGGVHFVLVDSPVMNTGGALEAEQWAWLEADLAHAQGRVLLFTHYPLFVCEPDEDEHYDNIAEPARGRLLALLRAHRVEAVFSGHAHTLLLDRRAGTAFRTLPAVGFVRPDYAELAPVPPGREFGRDEPDRLGFTLVHVEPGGLRVEVVRLEGGPCIDEVPALRPGVTARTALGVTLREDWSRPVGVRVGNLDELNRKAARPDGLLVALEEMGVRRLRVPVGDLRDAAARARLEVLAADGWRFLPFGPGVPDGRTLELLERYAPMLLGLEVVVSRRSLVALGTVEAAVPVYVSAIGGDPPRDGRYFSHFPTPGYLPGESADLTWAPAGRVFRAPAGTADVPAGSVLLVEIPRAGEGTAADDDGAVVRAVTSAWTLAETRSDLLVFVDLLTDHDRGYWPRRGLLDRRGVPRPAGRVLGRLARLSPSGGGVTGLSWEPPGLDLGDGFGPWWRG